MPGGSSSESRVLFRLRTCWRLKLLLTVALNLFFWAGYGYLSRHAWFPLVTPPLTWVDRIVPFQPAGWSGIYLSEFAFTAIVPWLITSREALRRYAIGLLMLSSVSFLCFLFMPVASPRPAAAGGEGLHRFIVQWDGSYNAFPSLHAGFLVYTFALAWRMFPGGNRPWAWALGAIWGLSVLYSTVATRQHYFLDLPAGAVIGAAADALAWGGSGAAATGHIFTLPPERQPPHGTFARTGTKNAVPEAGAPPHDFPVGGSVKIRPRQTARRE